MLMAGGTLLVLSGPSIFTALKRSVAFVQTLNKTKETGKVNKVDAYNTQFGKDATADQRNANYASIVDSYYDLATEFYEWGWGQSFHFADRRKGETFQQSILRHEYYLAGRLGVNRGDTIIDCGCGIGGPARNIARFTGANIKGITINQFQVNRCNTLSAQQGLSGQVEAIQGDFLKLPFADNSVDGAYAIEATCHAPDRTKVFGEIYRVLKPGATFACYEWCHTDKYDGNNAEHRRISHAIAEGDGLPDICHTSVCDDAMKKVGFTLVEARDCAQDGFLEDGGEPWYLPLVASWHPLKWPRFQFNPVMTFIMPWIFRFFEGIRLIPAGTLKTQQMLRNGGIGCAAGGQTGIFTAMYLLVGKKPL